MSENIDCIFFKSFSEILYCCWSWRHANAEQNVGVWYIAQVFPRRPEKRPCRAMWVHEFYFCIIYWHHHSNPPVSVIETAHIVVRSWSGSNILLLTQGRNDPGMRPSWCQLFCHLIEWNGENSLFLVWLFQLSGDAGSWQCKLVPSFLWK